MFANSRRSGSFTKILLMTLFVSQSLFLLSLVSSSAASIGSTGASPAQITNPLTLADVMPNETNWIKPPVDCLIITTNALSPNFQPLADLKTSRGVFTQVLTVETILANATFSTGAHDTAESIRNAIKHYHQNRSTEFIIIGGDVDVVPIRYTYNPDTTETYFNNGDYYDDLKPTDQYYACLDGTWDQDGDGIYGEMNTHNANNVDEVDWDAEVFVGRLPANDATEADVLVNKIIAYELNPPAGDWFNETAFAGAVSQFQTSTGGSVDEAELSDFIIENYFGSMNSTRLYATTPNYTSPYPYTTLSTLNLLSRWNQGASVVNLAGHGDPCVYGGKTSGGGFASYLTALQAGTLSNDGDLPFVYIYACSSGAFDLDEIGSASPSGGNWQSLAETLVRDNNGGAIAVVAGMRTTYYFDGDDELEALNRGQDRFFWREFMVENEFQPGRTLYKSKETYIDSFINKYWNVDLNYHENLASKDGYMMFQEEFRKNILTYNLLGDPEISIYTAAPRNFSASVIPSTAYHGDLLMFDVKDVNGTHVPNARVLVNGSGYYITADANEFGIACVRIPHDEALIGTEMNVTLSGHNMLRYSSNITILNDTAPPTNFTASVPLKDIYYNAKLQITASGIDAGSGVKYACIVFVDTDSNMTGFHHMNLISIDGNATQFSYTYPTNFQPNSDLRFFIIGFDASGQYVLVLDEGDGYFTIHVKSRLIEFILWGVVLAGVPALSAFVLIWLKKSRSSSMQVSGTGGRTNVMFGTMATSDDYVQPQRPASAQKSIKYDMQHSPISMEENHALKMRLHETMVDRDGTQKPLLFILSRWLFTMKVSPPGNVQGVSDVVVVETQDIESFTPLLDSILPAGLQGQERQDKLEYYLEALRLTEGMAIWVEGQA
ncbi:MAG: C25 family cysteine peptidase [Promethearchaeota archaeon]